MNGKYEIDKETYKNMPPEDQNWILFKTLNVYRERTDQKIEQIQKKMSLWKKASAGTGAVTGLVGGFLAVIFKSMFFKG